MSKTKTIANMVIVILLITIAVLFFIRYGNAIAGDFLQTSNDIKEEAENVPDLSPSSISNLTNLPPFQQANVSKNDGIQRLVDINTIIPSRPRVVVTTYEVENGDNLFAIAEQYGLKPETILWGNYEILRDNPQFLKPGQILTILPTDGVYYQWTQGDQLPGIAEFFKVDSNAIIEWPGNEFNIFGVDQNNPPIEDGKWIIVPGGRRALKDWGPPAISRANPAAAKYYGAGYCGQIYEGAVGTGAFVWPTTSTFISGYDYNINVHPGLDIGGPEGNAVYASDSGVVVYSGWSEFGYGYLIVLDHGNGWQTAYAHLSAVGVTCGQSVARGTMIGRVGNTGNSTGPHLHFEMRSEIYGKVNPWNFISP